MFSHIKDWLQKSGTYGHQGNELIDELPFERFFKHKDYSWFWLYEEDFFNRIEDAFEVIVGTHYGERKTRKGLLDVFIFPIISRRLLYLFIEWANWMNHRFPGFFPARFLPYCILPVVYPVIFTIEVIRFSVAGLLTLLVTPIIAIVHGLTYFKTQKYLQEIRHLQLIPHPNSIGLVPCELGARTAMSIAYTSAQGFILSDGKTGEKAYIIELKIENLEGIGALLAINAFNVLNKISSEHLIKIQNWLSTAFAPRQLLD